MCNYNKKINNEDNDYSSIIFEQTGKGKRILPFIYYLKAWTKLIKDLDEHKFIVKKNK